MSDSQEPIATEAPRAPLMSRWAQIAGLFLLWSIPGMMFASQIYSMNIMEGRPTSWSALALWQVPTWLVFAPATYVVLWMGRRFPFTARNWLRIGPLHLLVATLIAVIHSLFGVWITRLAGPVAWQQLPIDSLFGYIFLSHYHFAILIYGAILGVGFGLEYYRKFRERELLASQLQAQLAHAQLQALKMQLHPHFLFNTLNAISVCVRKGSSEQAITMLAGLSDLLRIALENSTTQEVSLRQELDFLDRYLALQQIRFQDRLRVQMDVAPETLDAQVPNLILQPLVENAIRHGIAPHSSAGSIQIRSQLDASCLRVEILDDGPGFSTSEPPVEGVGISNTRKRLVRLYGDAGRLTLSNGNENGALVVLEIPFQRVSG